MIDAQLDLDSHMVEVPCAKSAVGTTEDGVRVCGECAKGMQGIDVRVDFDASESASAGGTVGLEPASESESAGGDAPGKERP
jgi:hypothetical protein